MHKSVELPHTADFTLQSEERTLTVDQIAIELPLYCLTVGQL